MRPGYERHSLHDDRTNFAFFVLIILLYTFFVRFRDEEGPICRLMEHEGST